MPLSDEVSRDTEYQDTGQDQQRDRADDAAVQTIAREMTAHGLNPLDAFPRGNGFRLGWFHPIGRCDSRLARADVAERQSGLAIGR